MHSLVVHLRWQMFSIVSINYRRLSGNGIRSQYITVISDISQYILWECSYFPTAPCYLPFTLPPHIVYKNPLFMAVLQHLLIHGKASPLHLADPRNHHKAGRVNAMDDFLQPEELPGWR